MKRRTFVTTAASAATLGVAGCLEDTEVSATSTDEEHVEELRTDVGDRGVEVHDIELDGDVVDVEHGYEKRNDAVANVAMAFVDRVAAGWEVDRLDGYLRAEGGSDYTWHAEAAWARAYADGEIEPGEYGQRISETVTLVLESGEETA